MGKKYSVRQMSIILSAVVAFTLMTSSLADIGRCDNSDTVVFNCSGVELTTIPSYRHVPSYYHILDFSNNYISNVSKLEFLPNNNITTLLLNDNKISRIEPKAFALLKNLTKLDLSGNVLEGHTLDESQFDDLQKLERLVMERNPLHLVRKDTFHFMELFALKHLDLSHCYISEIEYNAIDVPSLEYLDLSWNNLKTIHNNSFTLLHKLKTFDLSHNQLTVLDQVPYLPELQVWVLDNNKINKVSVSQRIHHVADNLKTIYIRNNDLTNFGKESFPWDLPGLEGVYLDNNPINCDCQMRWAVKDKDLRDRNFTIPCKTPSQFRGKNLLTISPTELSCGIHLPVGPIVLLIGLIVAVLLCFMTAFYCIVKRRKNKTKKNRESEGENTETIVKRVNGKDYSAVYTKEADEIEINVQITDRTKLLTELTEEDV